MNAPGREVMTVFVDGEEMPGVIIYGLRPRGSCTEVVFPADNWPNADARSFRLHGESWEIVGWNVALRRWPRGGDWRGAVRRTLKHLLDTGSVVAWIGAEGLPFSDPPDLFSPDWMSGSVLAAMVSSGEFFCPVDPDLPVRTLCDAEMAGLRFHARGLADASS